MPEAVVFILRAVVLVLLWGFVVAAIVAVRHDLLDVRPARATAGPAPEAGPEPELRGRSRGRRAPAPARQLVVVEGAQAGTAVALGRLPVTIGRAADCGLVLSDDYASNHHARLVPAGDGWRVEDTGSTNGTYVADKQAPGAGRRGGRRPDPDRADRHGAAVVTLFLRVGARSDVGLVRDGNEDSLFAGHRLFAVADGVGGAAYGEVASATTISTLAALDGDATDDLEDPLAALRSAVGTANDRLRELTDRDPKLAGMGTTLTALLWSRERLALAQVGDSRAYRRRDGSLDQISHDQTFVQTLVDEGRISPEQAFSHPQRSVILNAIDGRDGVEPVLDLLDPEPGDRYLVCSDGLSDYVVADDIEAGLAEDEPQASCERLVALALAAGAPDNVSCIVADVVESPPAADERLPIIGGAATLPPYQSPDNDHPTTDLQTGNRPARTPRRNPPPRAHPSHRAAQSGIGRRLGIVIAVVVVLVAAAVVGTSSTRDTSTTSRERHHAHPPGGDLPGRPRARVGVRVAHQGHHEPARHRAATGRAAAGRRRRDQRLGGVRSRAGVSNLRHDACALRPRTAERPAPPPADTLGPRAGPRRPRARHHTDAARLVLTMSAVTEVPQTRRGTELALLLVAVVLTLTAFTSVSAAESSRLPSGLLTDGLAFTALAVLTHLAVRRLAPYADPVLLPAAIALNGLGLVLIHRLDLHTPRAPRPPARPPAEATHRCSWCGP